MSALKLILRARDALIPDKTGLLPALAALLLLLGLAVSAVWAAPPGQSPTEKPSAARGEALWAENCAPCHGVGGRGDGPTTQSSQMAGNRPPDLTDLAAARQRTLAGMFAVTKQGRMDRMMPPWGSKLSDAQIWDVVAYAQTFAAPPEAISAGKAIYQANCQECHAADGTGAAPNAGNLTDVAAMATQSPQALFDIVSQGRDKMPAFVGQLSEDQRWQVVDYLRTFSYEPIRFEGVITGQVKNGTTGQLVGNVEVRLRRWQDNVELSSFTTQADAAGNFRFEGLDTGSQVFYRAEVTYDGIPFPARFVSFEPGATQLSLPLDVYETTADDTAITVDRFHFIIMSNQPGSFDVLELYQFSNRGDRAYVGSANKDGIHQTVRIALPAGAQDLSLQGGTLGVDFLQTDGGIAATSPVVPGTDTFDVAFLYAVPYEGKTLSLNRPLYYNTDSVNGLLLDVGAKLTSGALAFAGERDVQGQIYLQYSGQNLKAGDTLPMQLDDLDKVKFATASGAEASDTSASVTSGELNQRTLLWLMLGLGGAAVVLGLAYPRLRPRLRREVVAAQGDPALERQRLLLTLARLDEAYQAGQLNETVYRRVRARRKAELIEIMRRLQEEEL